MIGRLFVLGLGIAVLIAAIVPASAQVDDFLCSTFSFKCDRSPKLPPPQLAPEEAPAKPAKDAAVAKKHRTRHAKAETGAAASAPAAK